MSMNPNMMMGGMNPMMQMMMNMMQNQGMGGQQMPQMRGGGMDCDEFEECLEKYCREVANGRREVPRAFKKMIKKAWKGAKEAVSGGRYSDDDDEDDEDDYSDVRNGRRYSGGSARKGKKIWDKIEKLTEYKGNTFKLNEEMMKCFPNASPDEVAVIRKMVQEFSPETRKHLYHLMQNDED